MAYVIAVLNQKGGAGKTTLATNLSTLYARAGLRALLADADPQGTARNWRDVGPENGSDDGPFPAVVGADSARLGEALSEIGRAFDVIVIDGPPGVSSDGPGKITASALKAADLVLIPVRPSAADVWASRALAELVTARRDAIGRPDAAFVVSQADPRTSLAREVASALDAFEVPTLDARTEARIAYAEALGAGLSVLTIGDRKAAAEVEGIASEIGRRFPAPVPEQGGA